VSKGKVTLIVDEDEWWPWLSFADDDKFGYARGVVEVDEKTAQRWKAGLKAAEDLQTEIYDALEAKYGTGARRPRK